MNERPLRILLADPHQRGGGQVRYVAVLAAKFTAIGHQVSVACRPQSILSSRARQSGCTVHDGFHFRSGLHVKPWYSDILAARRLIAAERPDIVHVSASQDHWAFGFANYLLGSPAAVVRTRHNTYRVSDSWPNRLLNKGWTDYQIVVCETVRTELARSPVFDPARMQTIHNGVDANLYRPDPATRAQIRSALGYNDAHVVCGIAARLAPAKGHQYLLRAVALLHAGLPALRVLILGEGALRQELEQLARDLGIASITTFAGYREDMSACTQAFDVSVMPSIDCDTSSFSLKESMAAEKPVVASDYGGLTEIVTDGVEGYVVPAGTVEPLAQRIGQLAEDPDRRAAMGRAARARVVRDFTVETFAARTLNVYRETLRLHNERAAHR